MRSTTRPSKTWIVFMLFFSASILKHSITAFVCNFFNRKKPSQREGKAIWQKSIKISIVFSKKQQRKWTLNNDLITFKDSINTTSKLGLPSNLPEQYCTSAISWTEGSKRIQVRVDVDVLERSAAYSLLRKSIVFISFFIFHTMLRVWAMNSSAYYFRRSRSMIMFEVLSV